MKYPEMRKELLDYLFGLSDSQYQRDCWVNRMCPGGVVHDELDYAIHFLFDDTKLAEDSESLIGVILKDKKEAYLVASVCEKIQYIFDKYGYDMSDEAYISLPEWKCVLQAAKEAHEVISSSH